MTIAFTSVAIALQALYGTTKPIGQYLGETVDNMKKSPNESIARTGLVIEAAKLGFGIGYVTPIVIVAMGQMILGNPLQAVGAAVTMAVNPFAITCAAVGAIYYGWSALGEAERDAIVTRLGEGLAVGVEVIRAIAAFITRKLKELSSPESLGEIKAAFAQAVTACSEKLGELTGAVKDQLSSTVQTVTAQLKGTPAADATALRPRTLHRRLEALVEADRRSHPGLDVSVASAGGTTT